MARLTRRLLLGSAGIAVVGGAVYGSSRYACAFVPRNHPDFFSLLDMAPEGDAAQRIGRLALASDALPSSLPEIVGALGDRALTRAALSETCPTTRTELVREQCALDFNEGRIVVLDGWLLSETEANICAGRLLCRKPAT